MISPETIVVVGVAALVIFGGKKLPELGKGLGQGIRAFKRGVNDQPDDEEAEKAAVIAAPVTMTPAALPVTSGAVPQAIQVEGNSSK